MSNFKQFQPPVEDLDAPPTSSRGGYDDGLPETIMKDGHIFPGPLRPDPDLPRSMGETLGLHGMRANPTRLVQGKVSKDAERVCDDCRHLWRLVSEGGLQKIEGSSIKGEVVERFCLKQAAYQIPLEGRYVTACNRHEGEAL